MVNLTPSASRVNDIKYFGWAVYEDVELSQAFTITLGEFIDDVNLDQIFIVNNIDAAEVAGTIANNVITITSVVTDVECTIFVFGRRA